MIYGYNIKSTLKICQYKGALLNLVTLFGKGGLRERRAKKIVLIKGFISF